MTLCKGETSTKWPLVCTEVESWQPSGAVMWGSKQHEGRPEGSSHKMFVLQACKAVATPSFRLGLNREELARGGRREDRIWGSLPDWLLSAHSYEDWGTLQGSLQRALLGGPCTHPCSCSQSGPAAHILGNAISSWLPLSPTHTFHCLGRDLCPITNSHSIITG